MFWALAGLALAQQEAPLDWLAGTWCTDPAAGEQTCESWTPMVKGAMRGEGTTRKNGAVATNEIMTIRSGKSGIVFHAEPAGQKPADFALAKLDPAARSASFEDATHDYPQRVRYWREGEALLAEIALRDGSKAVRWTFHRAN